jgi:hypothetical protein
MAVPTVPKIKFSKMVQCFWEKIIAHKYLKESSIPKITMIGLKMHLLLIQISIFKKCL